MKKPKSYFFLWKYFFHRERNLGKYFFFSFFGVGLVMVGGPSYGKKKQEKSSTKMSYEGNFRNFDFFFILLFFLTQKRIINLRFPIDSIIG